jgi:hypothetical protein
VIVGDFLQLFVVPFETHGVASWSLRDARLASR